MKNIQLRSRTQADIDQQVAKVLRGLGNPQPPLDLSSVRELLKLDRQYYSTVDDMPLREFVSRLKVAGKQILLRPTLLLEAVRKASLKALYLPDQKRILLDSSLPILKHRWNEAHEIGHSIVPWHADMMLGDDEQTLTPICHAIIEAEANYAAGQMLFLQGRFAAEATSSPPDIAFVQQLKKTYGNTLTTTLWRFVETAHVSIPMVGLVTCHPHPARRDVGFNASDPCRYFVESPSFASRFGNTTEVDMFSHVESYCSARRGGPLGGAEIVLNDRGDEPHVFHFETFFNSYDALTLGVWKRKYAPLISVP